MGYYYTKSVLPSSFELKPPPHSIMPRVDPPECCPCFQMCQLLFQTALAAHQMPELCCSHPLGDTSSVRYERVSVSEAECGRGFSAAPPVLLLQALAPADSHSDKHSSVWGAASPRDQSQGRPCWEGPVCST